MESNKSWNIPGHDIIRWRQQLFYIMANGAEAPSISEEDAITEAAYPGLTYLFSNLFNNAKYNSTNLQLSKWNGYKFEADNNNKVYVANSESIQLFYDSTVYTQVCT